MRLSTRARYGVRALLDIAQNSDQGPVPLRDIADRQRLSGHYLENLLVALKLASLVRSSRGTGGGFILTRSPSQIRLDEVMRVLEGPTALVECVDHPEMCPVSRSCAAHTIWEEASNALIKVLQSRTLQDLVDIQKSTGSNSTVDRGQ
ncbi:MAG: RrF2 family transcriptional regulator [Dehalococcoidia bacterium]